MTSFFRGWWNRDPAFLRGTERVLLRSQAEGRTATDRLKAAGRVYLTTERLVWPQAGWWGRRVGRSHTGTIEVRLSEIRAVVIDQRPPSLIILTDDEVYRVTLLGLASNVDLGFTAERVAEWRARLISLCPDLAWGPTTPLDPRIRQFLQAERRAARRRILLAGAILAATGIFVLVMVVVVGADSGIWWTAAPVLAIFGAAGAYGWRRIPPIEVRGVHAVVLDMATPAPSYASTVVSPAQAESCRQSAR